MSRLYMKQKVFSLGGRFTVKDDQEMDKYYVEGSFLKIPKTFTILDRDQREVALITKKVFSFLPKFFVDVDGEEIITIQKEFSFFRARYHIAGVGVEVQGDFWNKRFDVVSNGDYVARVNEKWFTWGDTYEIDVQDESYEHIVIALVVAIDFVKQEERNASNSGG
ncbi:Uncharacterized protein YxjI [Amphibacillus marinus]|uniref:Uncharacterized protein YxjI n=1 Tax=Amphibacillus marinus TaxID=872970 RepID=A0A1H8M5E9_9BACI|nr:LURP-one-related family protein [Amphibacillus marinus]SEO12490.1 Uncharacterized protein YxjI [Amphibacillus marinus]